MSREKPKEALEEDWKRKRRKWRRGRGRQPRSGYSTNWVIYLACP